MSIHTAHFPYQKEIKDFDFNFQPSVDKEKITNLMSMEFVENARNVLFIGSSGVGKTHLATGLGVEACKNHLSTYFVNCHELIERLKLAYQENRLEPMLKNYLRYKLLIIDEIGYLPIDNLGSNLSHERLHGTTYKTAFKPVKKYIFKPVISDNFKSMLTLFFGS